MNKTMGCATYRDGKLYFDAQGWAALKKLARKKHKCLKKLVIEGLERGFKLREKA